MRRRARAAFWLTDELSHISLLKLGTDQDRRRPSTTRASPYRARGRTLDPWTQHIEALWRAELTPLGPHAGRPRPHPTIKFRGLGQRRIRDSALAVAVAAPSNPEYNHTQPAKVVADAGVI